MKILLSAYACEPGKGSEPGIGWNWALELARLGHEVDVLTRANNEEVISKAQEPLDLPNLKFIYFDKEGLALKLKNKLGRFGIYWYYYTWQKYAYNSFVKFFTERKYDLVHHITIGNHRAPSFLWKLDCNFVFGPVGGGEQATPALRNGLPFKERVFERLREISTTFAIFQPSLKRLYKNSQLILTKTDFTKDVIPAEFQEKTYTYLEIGANLEGKEIKRRDIEGKQELKILYVGRMLYWKGVHIALRSFAQLSERLPNVRFTLVGKGKDKDAFKSLSKSLGIEDKVDWLEFLPQEKVFELYENHDLFLFPSFHDSSGTVILEAMTFGLPVVSLNLGGPAGLVNDKTGVLVDVEGLSEKQIIEDLQKECFNILTDTRSYYQKAQNTAEAITKLTWKDQVVKLYERIESLPAKAT